MPNQLATFHPPYLRYDKPSDLAQIQTRIADLRKKAQEHQLKVLSETKPEQATISALPINIETPPTKTAAGKLSAGRRTAAFTVPSELKQAEAPPTRESLSISAHVMTEAVEGVDPGMANKASSLEVNVSPSGTVSMGFNCKALFHATNNFDRKFTFWKMFFKDPKDGTFSVAGQFLGETYWPNAKGDAMDFEIAFDTYSEPAYMSADGTARFKISCENVLQPESATSAEVVLNFNAQHCIDLHSVSLSENTFVGGQNGNEPTMTVTLDAPAPPGGQRIYLSVSDTSKAGILGNHFFDIPAGKQSESISGFLGTEKVLKDRTVDIHVKAGGPITGFATIYLHKK